MPRAEWCRPEIYDTFDRWRRECLIGDGALFSDEELWTADNLRELATTFATVIEGEGTFIDKLERQIAGHPPSVRQLGVEIAYLELLCERDTGGKSKRGNLAQLGHLLPDGVGVPAELDQILDGGIASYGPGKARRDAYVRFLLSLARRAKQVVSAGGATSMDDPWAFRDVVRQVGTSSDLLQANAVLHTCFPDEFDVMISGGHQERVLQAFANLPGVREADDRDRQLLAPRAALRERMPTPILDTYHPGIRAIWGHRANPGWTAITAAMAEAVPQITGDLVGQSIESAPAPDPEIIARLTEITGGDGKQDWGTTLTEAAARLLVAGVQAGSWAEVSDRLERAVASMPKAPLAAKPAGPSKPETSLRAADQALSASLLLPAEWLQDTIDALVRKRQMVLYGPPGTGKTYLARALADHLTAEGGAVRTLQFHPSYAYEDFVQGYRPDDSAGTLTYALRPGPFLELSERAREDLECPYVLVVDEINRGNLAKVFGELYFLLEYRDAAVRLQYSDRDFSLPPNLYVIGTMNTADRSIALLDAALRRRFSFVEMTPLAEPVSVMLEKWLERQGHDPEPAVLLRTLNDLLIEADGDVDLAVGPSFFMSQSGAAPDVDAIWKYELLPLIHERFHGDRRDIQNAFGLKRVKAEASARADGASPSAEADPVSSAP